MNTKQIAFILIALGTVIFVLGFLGEILKFIFQSNILVLAFLAILVGLGMLGYSMFKENKKIKIEGKINEKE